MGTGWLKALTTSRGQALTPFFFMGDTTAAREGVRCCQQEPASSSSASIAAPQVQTLSVTSLPSNVQILSVMPLEQAFHFLSPM